MNRFDDLDGLLSGSETARIYFAALPDYIQGAVLKKSADIRTEDDLHRTAESVRTDKNEFV